MGVLCGSLILMLMCYIYGDHLYKLGMNSKVPNVVDKRFKPYVSGKYPYGHGLPWSEAEKIVGIGSMEPDHWVCYEIKLHMKQVVVYDSLSKSRSPLRTKKAFEVVLLNLERVCDELQVSEKAAAKSKQKWEVSIYSHPPQQGDSYDCAIFALKFMECLVTGNDLSIIHESHMEHFRQQYCTTIYRSALQAELAYEFLV